MTGLVSAILFGLNFLLFPSEGQIIDPPVGDTFCDLPGNNVTIAWGITGSLSDVLVRSWTFLPNTKSFVNIDSSGNVKENLQYSPGPFTIIEPSTLILNNINIQYNGTYKLYIFANSNTDESYVTLFVAVEPNVTINCSNPTTVNEGDNLTCVCTSEGGNPPANLTWYKDKDQIGNTTYGENILTLTNVGKDNSGIYTCIGHSCTLKNEKVIDVKVRLNFKPNNTILTPRRAVVGTLVVLTCTSEGLPEPSYIITHRNGSVVSNNNTYTISEVMKNDGGYCTYRCIAWNKLGNNSACSNLTIEPRLPPTKKSSPTTPSSSEKHFSPSGNTTTKEPEANAVQDDGTAVVEWHIVVTLVSGIILGLLFAYIVSCSRHCWCKKRKSERNADAQTNEVDTTYQELDLSKMNREDNYQSLKGNASASNELANDEESTYTELSKTKDVENNYQPLIT